MKTKFKVGLMTVLVLSSISLTACASKSVPVGNFSNKNTQNKSLDYSKIETKKEFDKEFKVSLKDINKINISTDVNDIFIKESDGDDLKIINKSSYELSEDEVLKVKSDKNTISIVRNCKLAKLDENTLAEKYKCIEIYLPSKYKDSISIKNGVGSIYIDRDLTLDELSIDSSLGKFHSGNTLTSNKFSLICDLGDVDLNRIVAKDYHILAALGNIEIKNLEGAGDIHVSTGNLECNLKKITGNVDISNDLGNISLSVDKSQAFNLNASCKMGSLNSTLDLKDSTSDKNSIRGHYGKNPTNVLKASCSLGSLSIKDK